MTSKQTSNKPYLELNDFDKILKPNHRFIVLSGKYGPYFHDKESNQPMTLENVLDRLNDIANLKERLFAANKHKRGEKW